MIKTYIKRMRGTSKSPPRKPLSKIIWSWVGAFLGIYLVSVMSRVVHVPATENLFLIGSFGASAVLIYGAPMADFSQPRNLIGGHIISAFIGITVYKFMPGNIPLASATAVSMSIAAMHFSRTIHPPGGATALIAVIGGVQIHELGYQYVLSPVATGALIMLLVALLVNNLSGNPKRHYPQYWL